jgi:hypothetical protein
VPIPLWSLQSELPERYVIISWCWNTVYHQAVSRFSRQYKLTWVMCCVIVLALSLLLNLQRITEDLGFPWQWAWTMWWWCTEEPAPPISMAEEASRTLCLSTTLRSVVSRKAHLRSIRTSYKFISVEVLNWDPRRMWRCIICKSLLTFQSNILPLCSGWKYKSNKQAAKEFCSVLALLVDPSVEAHLGALLQCRR